MVGTTRTAGGGGAGTAAEAATGYVVLLKAWAEFVVAPMGRAGGEGAGMVARGVVGIKGRAPTITPGRTVSTTVNCGATLDRE